MIRHLCFLLGVSALAAAFPQKAEAQLIINELMQSNIDCIMDDLNEFPDSWVELYNPGKEMELLSSYKIGDSEKLKKAYKLPLVHVAPGQHILVYCDKEGSGMHASFRLESGKDGSLFLFKDDEVVDKIEGMKKQPAPNIAYGRKTDAADEWGYQAVPTPGNANCGEICKEILPNPVFSEPGKVFSGTLALQLSLPGGAPEGSVIRYTLDGKEPTEKSKEYSGEIKISSSTVVRAKLLCDGWLSPRSLTHSYINHGRDVTLPIVSIVTDDAYFYDNKLGIYVDGNYKPGTPNYEYDWRRPVNYELFEGMNEESVLNQLCETRVKGGATRGSALKSLAVYANKRFGEKRFNYEFFPDQTPGVGEWKSFEMRNSGNDFDYTYMRDAVMQRSVGMNVDLDWQPSRPAIFYINGKYKGILNIRPRSNEDYVYSYYDGLEDIDMLENWYELKEGTLDNFEEFKKFYSGIDGTFEEFSQRMDVEEYCNLMAMEIFYDNKDFPGNNIVMWRPIAEGGRWRWIAKDLDFGMGLYGERSNYPTLNWITTPGYDNNHNNWANTPEGTQLFRHLLGVQEFKDMFIDRCAIYLGDFMKPDSIISLIDKRYGELKYEYKHHRNQINPWWPDYGKEIDNARKWTRERWDFFYRHLADFFKLSQPVALSIASTGGSLTVNGVTLATGALDGKYFPGRRLTLSSESSDGSGEVVGWNVVTTGSEGMATATYADATLDIEMPQASRVSIAPVFADDPGAVTALPAQQDTPCEVFDLSGRSLGNPAPSSLAPGVYVLRGRASSRKIIVR